MTVLARIKQLVVRRQIVLTEKVQLEMWRDSLEEDDLIESVINATRIEKALKSRHPATGEPERLYIIKGRTFSGKLIYTKGTIRQDDFRETFYIFVSGKRSL